MSATLVGEIWANRKTRQLRNGVTEHTRVFRVDTSAATDDGTVVEAASGVPVKGNAHPSDGSSFCVEVTSAAMSEDRRAWLVTCEYDNDLSYSTDPTTRPTDYEWSTERVKVALVKDLDGKTVENSAHECFDPAREDEERIDVIRATCIRSAFIANTDRRPYLGKENSARFDIDGSSYAPGQVILDDLDVSIHEENATRFRKYVYTFKARTDLFTDTSTTLNADASTGDDTISVSSMTGIVVGGELVINPGEPTEEAVIVIDISPLTLSLDLVHDHASGEPVSVRTYTGWQTSILDAGYNEWDDVNNVNVEILTKTGQPIGQPALLDGFGGRLATWAAQEPVRLPFRTTGSVDLSAITFP